MKKILNRAAAMLGLLGCAAPSFAQDVHFSQFYENAMMRNPALTGIFSGDYKAGVNYRNQWSSYGVSFVTALVSAEAKVLVQPNTGDYLSFGLTAVHDKAGSLNFTGTSVYGALSYNKALGDERRTYLSVGLAGGYVERRIDFSRMTTAAQFVNGAYNPSNPTNENLSAQTVRHYDVAAGLSLNSSLGRNGNFFLGAAAYHIAQPNESYNGESFIRLTMRWSGNAGLRIGLNERTGLTLHANYQYQQPYREVIGGGLLSYNCTQKEPGRPVIISGGCFYRYEDALIPTLKLDYGKWALTMSYDVSLAGSRKYLTGFGGYEVSLFTRGFLAHTRRPADAIQCPRFELLDNSTAAY